MTALWQRTKALIAENPGLWLPVLVAELCSYAAACAEVAVRHPLMYFLLTKRQSVLTTERMPVQSPSVGAMAILAGLRLAPIFFSALFYLAAYLITIHAVRRATRREQPIIQAASLYGNRSHALRFALWLLAVVCVSAFIFLASMALASESAYGLRLMSNKLIGYLGVGLVVAGAAYFLVPRAIRLVTAKELTVLVRNRTTAVCRAVAIVAVVSSAALQYADQAILHTRNFIYLPSLDISMAQEIGNLFAAVPYLFLFVFMGMSIVQGESESAQSGVGSEESVISAAEAGLGVGQDDTAEAVS